MKKSWKERFDTAYQRARESEMRVTYHSNGDGSLKALLIDVRGYLSALPGKSNSYTRGRGGVFQSPEVRGRTQAMDELFEMWKLRLKRALSFDGDVTVHVLCAKRKQKFDSHNVPKFVGDWLEKMGVLTDDSRAEIFAIKKEEYPAQFGSEEETRIAVFCREFGRGFTLRGIRDAQDFLASRDCLLG